MSDRRRAAAETNGRNSEEHNPFAPPPEGAPDRPWRPRGEDRDGGPGRDRDPDAPEEDPGREEQNRGWGSQWSRRQPQRQSGPFGQPPGRPGGRNGGFRPERRWDPSDPKQRRARYALLAGMWGVVVAWLGVDWLAVLLGAFGLYWGIDALLKPKPEGAAAAPAAVRDSAAGTGRGDRGDREGGGGGAAPGRRPQVPQATVGIVLASLALGIVALQFTVQMIYKDYFICVEDALTTASRESCEELIPTWLEEYLDPE
ncbi:hypothetical protein [Streptomyces sp. YIM 98790]|uniref:hypothetical protein n=1 Tax=Streptomyces sp. YIM 98790 TaxID=2689077 RepID=UPI0014097BBF|nr:hypothetical protein [Streptomyces sp. YIM 98790]